MHLLLLRHGQTESNVVGALDTAIPGAPLTALGERQAAAVPGALPAIDSIAVSTLLRTQQTAAPLAASRDLVPTIIDGLKEIQAGDLEMKADHRSQGEYNATAYAWALGDLDLRMPGGETGHEFLARYDEAIHSLAGETALVVSHGAAIRTWVASRCDNTSGAFAGDHQLPNTALVTLRSTHRGWHLVDWGDVPIGGTDLMDSRAVDPMGRGTGRS
jgi:broad specificity phosphatase PhoE